MKTNKLTLIVMGLALASLIASCKKDNNNTDTTDNSGFIATTEQNEGSSKTQGVLNAAGTSMSVQWVEGDQILIANQGGAEGCTMLTYTLAEGNNSTEGTFTSSDENEAFLTPAYVSIYPVANTENVANSINETTATFQLPATQTYQENSFAEKAMPMVAYSTNEKLQFKNIMGGLCFPMVGNGIVTKVVLTSKADEALWGTCTTTISTGGGNPISEMEAYNDAVQKSITLDCSANGGIALGSDPIDFYIMVPVGSLVSGFTIKVYNDTEVIFEKSTNWTENYPDFVSRSCIRRVNSNLTVNVDDPNSWPGAINHPFCVGDNKYVYFSQGNLQYIGSAGNGSGNNAGAYWKFADNQWDYLGSSTAQDTQNLLVDRDLFSWGTSGYNYYDGYGCTNYGGYQPWCWNFNSPYCSVTSNLFDETGQADWGYNAISNGGDTENCGWRTLADDEWIYVFDTRTTSSGIRYAKANVNNVNGVILLPDDWSTSYYTLSNTNSPGAGFFSNTISASQWDTLEQHGAVFLPAAGCYLGSDGSGFASCGEQGYYWTSSYYHYSTTFSYYANNACIVVFTSNNVGPSAYQKRCYRYSVRLVRNVE